MQNNHCRIFAGRFGLEQLHGDGLALAGEALFELLELDYGARRLPRGCKPWEGGRAGLNRDITRYRGKQED